MSRSDLVKDLFNDIPYMRHREAEILRDLLAEERPQFDFCFFDGGHTWDVTGFGVLLVDLLLRPGGILLLDDHVREYPKAHWGLARKKR